VSSPSYERLQSRPDRVAFACWRDTATGVTGPQPVRKWFKLPSRQYETQELNRLISGGRTWNSVGRRATEVLRVKSVMQQYEPD